MRKNFETKDVQTYINDMGKRTTAQSLEGTNNFPVV
jgi:hypothetical protein